MDREKIKNELRKLCGKEKNISEKINSASASA